MIPYWNTDIVSLAHNPSFWAQKVLKQADFYSNGLFFVPIELQNNPKHVQLVLSFSIGQNSLNNCQDEKLSKCVSYWPQKLTHN